MRRRLIESDAESDRATSAFKQTRQFVTFSSYGGSSMAVRPLYPRANVPDGIGEMPVGRDWPRRCVLPIGGARAIVASPPDPPPPETGHRHWTESLQGLVDVGGAREGVAAPRDGLRDRRSAGEGVWGDS